MFGTPIWVGDKINSWKWNPANWSASKNCSLILDFSNPLTFSMSKYFNEFKSLSRSQIVINASHRESSRSWNRPSREKGWQGGDIKIVFTCWYWLKFIFWMFLLRHFVDGKFSWYVKFAFSFMSIAAIIFPWIKLSKSNKLALIR